MKILFILKERCHYGSDSYFSSGLYWSSKFVADMLKTKGLDVRLVQVVDNNDIDREVSKFKPDIAIIEALWVTPSKFDVLKKLHPEVKWVVRIHSNVPFLSEEGVAIDWIKGYLARNIFVAVNEARARIISKQLLYLPNYYPLLPMQDRARKQGVVNVGCYGAIRPLKNQLLQAAAAIEWADRQGKLIRFHINGTRVERGENCLKNLRSLFKDSRHVLVEEPWFRHDDFVSHCRLLDVGMQVSLSETFNIVAADMVNADVPIVVSPEVSWAATVSKAGATNPASIIEALDRAMTHPEKNVTLNRQALKKYNEKSEVIWAYVLQLIDSD